MQYLEGLNEEQKKAAEIVSGPLLIVAGAGAGKTKTITHRIAHQIQSGVSPWNILALTFTNKAAREMRERVQKLMGGGSTPLMTTFHALGARLLREFHAEAGLERSFVIWDRDDSTKTLKRIVEASNAGNFTPRGVLSAISKQKGDGNSVEEFSKEATAFRDSIIARFWHSYEKAMREEGALDFDDLLLRTLSLLQKSPTTLEKLRLRWTYLTIDEYQDTNASQFEITRLLAGTTKNLCVVGDTDQLLYSWRGAKIENLLDFESQFPGTQKVTLERNYRSTRTILTAANAVIAKNRKRHKKNLFTENELGEPIGFYGARNEIDEAWFVAQTAAKLAEQGIPTGEMAVLYRENFQSRALEEALLAHSLPYRVLGTRFFERAEVKDVLSYVRGALNPKSKADMARIAAVPPRGIGKVTLDKMLAGQTVAGAAGAKIAAFQQTLLKIRHAVMTLPTSEAVRYAAEESGIIALYEKGGEEGEEHLRNIQELVNLAVRFDEAPAGGEPPTGVERLLEEAALQSDQDTLPDERSAISLMTVHASKGLEFDAVFVTGLEQGLFPSIRNNDSERDEEEERRLFYVAVTRARKRLFLSYAHERMKYGTREYTMPSEFLSDIDHRLLVEQKPKRSLLDDTFID